MGLNSVIIIPQQHIYTNQAGTQTGQLKSSGIELFAVHDGTNDSSDVDVSIEVIEVQGGDSFSLNTLTLSRTFGEEQSLLFVPPFQINFVSPNGTLPSSIIVNIKVKKAGSPPISPSLGSSSFTVQFTGEQQETCNLFPSGNEVRTIFENNISLKDGILNGIVRSEKTGSFDDNCNTNVNEAILRVRNLTGDILRTQRFSFAFFNAGIQEHSFTFIGMPDDVILEASVVNENGLVLSPNVNKAFSDVSQPDNMNCIVFAENGATLDVVVSVDNFNTLQGSLLQFGAVITGFATTVPVTHTVASIIAFAQGNQDINFNVTVQAEDGATLNEILSLADKDEVVQRAGDFKASVIFSPTTASVTSIASFVIQFMETHQKGLQQNFIVIVIAENERQANEILSPLDKDTVVNGVGIFNAFVESATATNLNITSSAIFMLQFAEANQKVTPLNNLVEVIADDGFRIGGIINNDELNILQAGLFQFNATETHEDTTLPINTTASNLLAFAEAHVKVVTNFIVIVTAENERKINEILSENHKNTLLPRLEEFNATATVEPTTLDTTSTVTIVLQFARDNQKITQNWFEEVTAEDGAIKTGVVNNEEHEALIFKVGGLGGTVISSISTLDVDSTTVEFINFLKDHRTPLPDDTVTPDMVTISPFLEIKIGSDRITGSSIFIAESAFNPFWYGKDILSFIQITFPDGSQIVKENLLNFTETERDETINYDQNAFGFSSAVVEFFVWTNDGTMRPFATKQTLPVEEGMKPQPMPTGRVVEIIKGAFFGLTALALLSSRGR